MKTLLFLPIACFGLNVFAAPAHAEDPASATLPPEMRALLVQWLNAAAQAKPEIDPAPAPEARRQPSEPRATRLAAGGLQTSGLHSGGLRIGTLAPSASVGGRGATGGLPRLSEEDWRTLFPLKRGGR